METPTAAVPVVPVAAAQPAQMEGGREEQRGEIEAPRQPTKLQAEMGRQPRSISEHYKGSGKLQDKARGCAGGEAPPSHDATALRHPATMQVAIITGADSGIGRAVAVAFAREGCNVVCCYLNEHEARRSDARAHPRPRPRWASAAAAAAAAMRDVG